MVRSRLHTPPFDPLFYPVQVCFPASSINSTSELLLSLQEADASCLLLRSRYRLMPSRCLPTRSWRNSVPPFYFLLFRKSSRAAISFMFVPKSAVRIISSTYSQMARPIGFHRKAVFHPLHTGQCRSTAFFSSDCPGTILYV